MKLSIDTDAVSAKSTGVAAVAAAVGQLDVASALFAISNAMPGGTSESWESDLGGIAVGQLDTARQAIANLTAALRTVASNHEKADASSGGH